VGRLLATVAIGFVSGVLSGMFGIGGGIVTTPAIRLLLGAPALVAVGTPLVAIIPSAITGAASYARSGVADVRAGVVLGVSGSATAVVGAWLTRLVGGTTVLVLTALLILYVAGDMLVSVLRAPRPELEAAEEAVAAGARRGPGPHARNEPSARSRRRTVALVGVGALTGLYSGFLGLGGGFVLVPMLARWLRLPLKAAIGTSLVAIGILSVPGAITHAVLGNVDWPVALALVIGVVPGAAVGARITLGASDRSIAIAFSIVLGAVGVWLAASELLGWGV
jgi:uncharacterized membrane protein YfcA